ncbi:lac repressor, partial [Escherichia coli]|nr:lac repressor [Escherichia coli]
VRQAFREAGERSVEWLMAPAHHDECWQEQLPVTLSVRHSTAPRAAQQADREDLAQQLRTLALLAEKLARS